MKETPFDELIATFQTMRAEFIALRDQRDQLRKVTEDATIEFLMIDRALDRLSPLISMTGPRSMMIDVAVDALNQRDGLKRALEVRNEELRVTRDELDSWRAGRSPADAKRYPFSALPESVLMSADEPRSEDEHEQAR